MWNGELIRCPQLPTTLPTLDELIGRDGITETNVAAHLLERTQEPARSGHVFTLHAELEGMRLAPAFEQLLAGWKAQGWRLVSMRTLLDTLQPLALPRCEVGSGTVDGRSGTLLVQGGEFLARDVDSCAQAAVPHRHTNTFGLNPQETPMLGKKVPDFSAPATGDDDVPALRPQGPPGRPLLLPQGQHARLHDRGRGFPRPAQAVRGSWAPSWPASRATTVKSHEGFKAEDGVSLSADLRRRREALRTVRRHPG